MEYFAEFRIIFIETVFAVVGTDEVIWEEERQCQGQALGNGEIKFSENCQTPKLKCNYYSCGAVERADRGNFVG